MSAEPEERQLPPMLLASPLPTGLTDIEGRWVAANEALDELLGTVPPGLAELLDEPGLEVPEILASDAVRSLRLRLPAGGDATALVSPASGGRRLVQLLDRSELRRLEDLAGAAATATATFVSRISHDLRNPIGTAQGYTELLLEDEDLGEEARGFVERIASSTRRALETVAEIVAETRASPAVTMPDAVELAAVVADVRAELAEVLDRRGASLATAGALPTLRIDRADLRLALAATVRNGIEHHPDAATVEISAIPTATGWVVIVEDDGPGVPAAERDAELAGGGPVTGLGLRLTRAAIARCGGTLEFADADGGGTQARLHVPQRRSDDPRP